MRVKRKNRKLFTETKSVAENKEEIVTFAAKETCEMNHPFELLSTITAQPANEEFGRPIAQAMQAAFGSKASEEEYTAAGIICALFLSAILAEFPTIKLHTYVKNYRDGNKHFSFDCKSYDKIADNINCYRLLLIDKDMQYIERKITKQDLLESLDFFTNR